MLGNRLPSLFKTHKPKSFEFKPRYYNETRERLDAQKQRVLREMEYEQKLENDPELKLREKMQEKWGVNSRKEAIQKSNRRVMMIAGMLAVLAYYFLNK